MSIGFCPEKYVAVASNPNEDAFEWQAWILVLALQSLLISEAVTIFMYASYFIPKTLDLESTPSDTLFLEVTS